MPESPSGDGLIIATWLGLISMVLFAHLKLDEFRHFGGPERGSCLVPANHPARQKGLAVADGQFPTPRP